MRTLDVPLGGNPTVLINETKRASRVLLTAARTNAGRIWYGDIAIQNQFLAPGEGPIEMRPYLLNEIYAYAETIGDVMTIVIED